MRIAEAGNFDSPLENLLEQTWQSTELTHLSITAGVADQVRLSFARNRAGLKTGGDQSPMFLVASLTKPVVSLLALQAVCNGQIALQDRVGQFVPEFARGALRRITIRNLLTHTSGLPDMLPNNQELRAAHATNEEFVRQTATVAPDFPVGTESRYSSMAFAVLGEILQRVNGEPLASTLRRSICEPLKMQSTWLGIPRDHPNTLTFVLPNALPAWQEADADWNWNSAYWRQLGAPWGGLITTAGDLARLSMALLSAHRNLEYGAILNPHGVACGFQNQLEPSAEIPSMTRRSRGWGYGWRLNWPDHTACFSDLLPPNAVGHWGATGTLWWIDPATERWAVLLSTTPYEVSRSSLQRMSNLLAARLAGDQSE